MRILLPLAVGTLLGVLALAPPRAHAQDIPTLPTNSSDFLLLTAPNGGETIGIGVSAGKLTTTITWTTSATLSGTIELDLMNSDGTSVVSSIADAETNDGTYTWDTAGLSGGTYRVRISATSNAAVTDQSDTSFTLDDHAVTLTAPNGGETIGIGVSAGKLTTIITWSSSHFGSDTVELDLMNSGGTSVISSIADAEANDGTYTWDTVGLTSGTYRVRISATSNTSATDQSDASFTLEDASVTLTAPNGGEAFNIGPLTTITWSSSHFGSDTVELDLMNSGGTSVVSSIADAETNDGTYTWDNTSVAEGTYRVRISATSNATVTDQSDASFTVEQFTPDVPSAPRLVLITAPNGGEVVLLDASTTITWTSVALGSDTVELDLLDNGGSVVSSIADAETNDGSFTWTPSGVTAGSYRVRISATSDASLLDQSDALFVIAIEPKLLANDGAADDGFGQVVSLSDNGTYALAGASSDDSDTGSAYVFLRNGTSWSQQQKLTASDAATGDEFGRSVALSADGLYALAGAFRDDDAGSESGSAYVFLRSGTTWSQQQKLTASDAASGDNFGRWVDISDDGQYAVMGAFNDDGNGSAYVFLRSGTTWSQQAKLTASDAASGDAFGRFVAISGDGLYALIGANGDDDGSSGSGSAYVFLRDGTSWSQQQKLNASDAATNDNFGEDVDINTDGTYAVVGAHEDGSKVGAAYVFTRSGTTWSQQQKLTASDAAASAEFGFSVSLDGTGTHALVGARSASSNGRTYLFERSSTTWSEQSILLAPDGASGDRFGQDVALSRDGTYGLIGAIRDGDQGSNSGSAYVLTVNQTSVLPVELTHFDALADANAIHLVWQTASEQANAGFEIQLQTAGVPTAPWQVMAWVDGYGTTAEAQTYRHTLAPPSPGRHTLRLRQVDFDGASSYSPEVEVLVETPGSYQLRMVGAHPVRTEAQFMLSVPTAQPIEAAIYDALGRRMAHLYQGSLNANTVAPLRWSTHNAAPGLYFLRIHGSSFAATEPFIVGR